ncbi:MAG: hypothetical protein ACRDQX_12405, partial [Pseudonocardiaceae bacterium]
AGLEPVLAAAAAVHAQELAAALAAQGAAGGTGPRGEGSGAPGGDATSGAPAPASAIQAALSDAIRALRSAARRVGDDGETTRGGCDSYVRPW